jgi:arginyl-tRNA synthetase
MKQTVTEILLDALSRAKKKGELKLETQPAIVLDTLAMTMAKSESKPPRKIAEIIIANLQDEEGIIENTEIAGAGFINFFFKQDRWKKTLFEIDAEGHAYGLPNIGKGERVLVEFVSANPTGPLHVGHGRGAAVGDALANLLAATGYDVTREFYINDAGRQIKLLSESVYARYQQALGHNVPFPEAGYHGDYIEEIAQGFTQLHGDKYLRAPFEACADVFGDFGKAMMLVDIKTDLEGFGVHFDTWFSEATLLADQTVQKSIDELLESRNLYELDKALWFRSTTFGDDKDRVVKKNDGTWTYLATDIAYHRNKLARGFKTLINIWGADHHGYIPRVQAVIQAFGHPKDSLHVLLVQLVAILRHGQPVPMSKRAPL